ncbi:calcium-activated chloride channel regulator 4A-like [Clavelina lepadiformis]|uniref:calcium-activated chloride channel regulator 4A-like n=1 Tax=Clavelina lepadiformis TaxID=159417 RepID=UPI004043549F
MFRPDLNFTETFCHNNASDPVNLHNTEAPNDQNRICNQKSVWEVIMTSRDFDSGQNQPNFDLDTVPNFRVVIPSTSRIVLVLDVSGSMSTNDRLTKMGQIVQSFIEDKVSSSAQVGIVQFGSVATVLSLLLSMNNQTNKDSLVGVIPAFTSGSTAIGRGILSGINVLENGSNSAAGGTIIVLTDGEENLSPYVADIHSTVTGKDVTLHTIFFAQATGNADLVNLTTSTGGSSYIGDDFNILSAFGAFDALARTEDGNLFDEVFEISSVSFTGTFHNDTVLMDSTIGNNTVFIFAWISGTTSPVIHIIDPSGCESVSTASSSGCSQPVDFQTGSTTTRALVTGIAKPGAWRYDITSSVADTFTILVSSRASDVDDPPYMVETSTGSVDITSLNPQAIYARVTKESQPVLGADVTAIIEIPASPARKFEKILLDNGAGADVKASDGVYSGFFTNFTNRGRYSLQVKVTNGNFTRVASDARSLAAKQTSRLAYFPGALPDGTVVALPVTDSTDVTEVANFTRIVTSPSFTYSGTVISLGSDSFPPNQITDLSATQLDVFDPNSGIVLSFTAPGDELDVGTASRYDIQYAFSPDTLDPSFGASSNLINSALVPAPTPAGTLEVININIPIPSNDRGTFRIALGVRATDEAGKTGDISNQVVVTYFSRAVELINPPTPSTEPPVTAIPDNGRLNITIVIVVSITCGAFVLAVVIAALVYLRSLKARRLPDERPAGKGYDNPDFRDRAYCAIPRPSVISTSRMSAYAEHIYDDVCVTDGRV